MEEKKRFEFDNCNFMIRDTIENNIYEDSDLDDIAILLNKQDKEIKQLKQPQKQLAVEELRRIKEYILLNDKYDEEVGCNIIKTFDLLEDIRDRIEKLGGEE